MFQHIIDYKMLIVKTSQHAAVRKAAFDSAMKYMDLRIQSICRERVSQNQERAA